MSLLTDQDYFLQSLRLAFLRLDAPLAASSTSHLVHPLPTYSLSQHAFHAGLSSETVPEFGLSRSPGPIPSTSSSNIGNGRPNRSGINSNNNASGSRSLKHSQTIVGRQDGKGAASTGAGIRVEGKRSSWRPKAHHLEALSAQNTIKGSGRDRSAASTLRAGQQHRPPQLVFDSPDGSPQLGFPATGQGRSDDDSDNDHDGLKVLDNEDEGDGDSDTDTGHAGIENVLGKYRPSLTLDDRSLSHALANQQPTSPTESYTGSGSQASMPKNESSHIVNGNGEAGISVTDSMTDSVLPGAGESLTSEDDTFDLGDASNRTIIAGIDEDSEEEDDFEFSLHGRDATSSFEASQPGTLGNPAQNAGNLVSPMAGSLPSIAEDIENIDNLLGQPGQEAVGVGMGNENAEDAALKAAQSARRRARRRVNISGRIPLPMNLGSLSPELESIEGPGSTVTSPGGTATVTISPVFPNPETKSHSVHASPSSSRPATPSSAILQRPMSPSSPLAANSLLRTRSGRLIKTRQRAQTDPVPGGSANNSPLPSPNLHHNIANTLKNGSSTPPFPFAQRNRSFTSQSLSTPPTPGNSSHLRPVLDGEASPGRNESDPSKPPVKRSKSAGSNDSALSPLRPLTSRPTLSVNTKSTGDLRASTSSGSNTPLIVPAVLPSPITPNASSYHRRPGASPSRSPSKQPNDPYLSFPITKKVFQPFLPPKQSALSLMLKSEDSSASSGSNNPFNENYGALFAPVSAVPAAPARRGRGPAAGGNSTGFDIKIYYPFSKEKGKPIQMSLKTDLVVEEMIGCALWKYWEADRRPSLCPSSPSGGNDEKWEDRPLEEQKMLSTSNWVLRIADEDEDGEVDDDFPAPDRTRAAKGFGNCFAVVEASSAQVKQNQMTDMQLQRRPSRIVKRIQRPAQPNLSPETSAMSLAPPLAGGSSLLPPGANGAGAASSVMSGSFVGTPSRPSGMGGSSSAPLVYLRIRIPLQGLDDINTTLQVPRDMYLADVLEMTCKKRSKYLQNPKDWVLTVPDRGIIVPLDRTVESLQGAHQLALQKKSTLRNGAAASGAARGQAAGLANTNPNASIFKRLSEPPQPKYVTSADINTNYRSYVVQRKMPMPLGRHERILSLDNDYIHIMSSDTKLSAGQVRTASYHVSQVANCKTSKRAPSSFKLIVWRDKERGDVKRYDFEAANGKMATEIAETVKALMQNYKEGMEQDMQS